MATEDEELMAEGPGEEDGGESSNRTFMMLALGLGGLFIVGVICIVAIFFYQQSLRNTQVAKSNAQIAKNATAIAEATAQAMAALVTTEAPTSVPPAAPTAAPTLVLTNTPVPVAATAATPTTIATATAAKPATAVSATKPASGATSGSTTAEATATLTAGQTPQTGVGGLGMVLAATALLVVLFAARRLRLAQH